MSSANNIAASHLLPVHINQRTHARTVYYSSEHALTRGPDRRACHSSQSNHQKQKSRDGISPCEPPACRRQTEGLRNCTFYWAASEYQCTHGLHAWQDSAGDVHGLPATTAQSHKILEFKVARKLSCSMQRFSRHFDLVAHPRTENAPIIASAVK